jgi:hypothetical protein
MHALRAGACAVLHGYDAQAGAAWFTVVCKQVHEALFLLPLLLLRLLLRRRRRLWLLRLVACAVLNDVHL